MNTIESIYTAIMTTIDSGDRNGLLDDTEKALIARVRASLADNGASTYWLGELDRATGWRREVAADHIDHVMSEMVESGVVELSTVVN